MDQIRLRPSNPEACLERAKMLWEQKETWPRAGSRHEEGSWGHL